MNHSERTQSRQPVHFIRSEDAYGLPCYFVMRLSPASLTKLQASKHKATDLTQYGEILHSGFGTLPSPAQSLDWQNQYGLTIPTE